MRISLPATVLTAALALTSTACFAASSSDFLKDAAQGNMAEIKVGQLAQQNGESQGVKSFGQMLVTDHTDANKKVMDLASTRSVTLPTAPKKADADEYDKLSKLHGHAFDVAFTNDMIEDHRKDISDFNKEAGATDDQQVAKFAQDSLPVLRKHLQTAQTLKGQGS